MQEHIVIKTIGPIKARELVNEALAQRDNTPQLSQAWIVFDRDQVKDFDKILSKAEDAGVKVGWSNICIETWFSMYFGNAITTAISAQCCDNFKELFKK